MAGDRSNHFKTHPYVLKAQELNLQFTNRLDFHDAMEPVLMNMADDRTFMLEVMERNFSDKGWLTHNWSAYNIPFFYVYEDNDMVIKVHLFPAGPDGMNDYAAHAIHHHNNYLLTTYAFFGSGYESMLFDKKVDVDESSQEASLKVSRHFHQRDWNPSRVDSWEPHIVFLPESLSATFIMWTPDVKRKTDRFRNSKLLKPFKKELRHLIYKLGAADKVGIAREKTYQFYVNDGKLRSISEEDFFAPLKASKGLEDKDYAMRMIFSFMQKAGLLDEKILEKALGDSDLPDYFKPFIQKVLKGGEIEEVLHRYEMNIPNKSFTKADILRACDTKQAIEL